MKSIHDICPDLPDNAWSMLIEWMVGVVSDSKRRAETLFLSVELLYRVLNIKRKRITRSNVQLYACACIRIASKIYDEYELTADEVVAYAGNFFERHQLNEMEEYVHKLLKYDYYIDTIHDILGTGKLECNNMYTEIMVLQLAAISNISIYSSYYNGRHYNFEHIVKGIHYLINTDDSRNNTDGESVECVKQIISSVLNYKDNVLLTKMFDTKMDIKFYEGTYKKQKEESLLTNLEKYRGLIDSDQSETLRVPVPNNCVREQSDSKKEMDNAVVEALNDHELVAELKNKKILDIQNALDNVDDPDEVEKNKLARRKFLHKRLQENKDAIRRRLKNP